MLRKCAHCLVELTREIVIRLSYHLLAHFFLVFDHFRLVPLLLLLERTDCLTLLRDQLVLLFFEPRKPHGVGMRILGEFLLQDLFRSLLLRGFNLPVHRGPLLFQ